MVISYGGKDIYDSGTRLYRDAIVFDDGGSECLKRPDNEYVNIFVAEGGNVEGKDTSPDCTISLYGKGYLYRALMNDKTYIAVNGTNLFPIERMISGFTLNMSAAPVSYCRYLIDQQECTIFTKQIILIISSENQAVEKKYRLMVDETLYPLGQYSVDAGHSFSIALPAGEGVHELRIIENATQNRVYTLLYVVFEGFSLRFEGFYYSDNYNRNGTVEISDYSGINRYPYKILYDQESMLVPYGEGDLTIDIPILRCLLNNEVLPVNPERMLWHQDIPMSALLEVDTPRGYSCTVVIGQRTFESEKVEIGNEIRAKHDSSIEVVGVIIRNGDESALQIKLFDIAFEPFFKSEPLLAESKDLLWCVEDNYIGDKGSEFELSIRCQGNEIGLYRVGCADEIIPLESPLEDGVYDYTVFKKTPGFFAKLEEFLRGQVIVGDPVQFRFHDRAIIVTEAIIENERIKLKPESGIITKLQYIGERGLNGETQHYPCYEGCLQFKYDNTIRPYASKAYVRDGIYREQVNPVKLWIINEYTISLRDPLDDGLYVNKKWSSITDRIPPRGSRDYCNPDYYSFKVIAQSEVENV